MDEAPRQPHDLPLVSAIVATRERPELLQRALKAILGQDYPGPIEVVVVFDGGECDETLRRDDPTRRVVPLRNGRTPGLAGARNTGALTARGQWLAFCDDDDVWASTKIVKQLSAAGGQDANVVVTGVRVSFRDRETDRIPSKDDLSFAALLRSRTTAAHPSTVMVRRDYFLDEVGLVDEALPGSYGEDYDWLLRAARSGRIAVVPEPLATVLWGSTSFFADRWTTMIEAIRYLLRKYPEFSTQPAGVARLYGRMAFAYAASGQRKEARRWARASLRLNWRERRAYVAFLVSTGVVPPARALQFAHATGRGI